MADTGARNLGTIVPGARIGEPNARSNMATPLSRQVNETESVSSTEPIFAADLPEGSDALGLDAPLELLAELAAHERAQTPLTIGLFGRSGSGKSFAATKLLDSIEALSRAAREAEATPYVREIHTVWIDADQMEGNPAGALAGALYTSLARTYPDLAAEAVHATRDPQVAAREALDQLAASQRKLESEKLVLDEADARRARLPETVLYEMAGSQVDAYARAHQNQIKILLSRFGFADNPLLAYKDLVGTIAGAQGFARHAGFALRAFLALKGQTRLIVFAILLFLTGIGLGPAIDQQTTWLGWLRANETSVPIGNWLEAHMDLLIDLRNVVFFGAAFALGLNVWRGSRLIQLVLRGDALLQADLAARRREADGLFAHQARRVDSLAAEVNILSRRAADADRRATDTQSARSALVEPSPFTTQTVTRQAQAFAASISDMIARTSESSKNTTFRIESPQRIVVALDNLDAVPPSRMDEILTHARRLFKAGFVVLIAADPHRLPGAAGETVSKFDKWIQIPFQISEITSRANFSTRIKTILGGQATSRPRILDAGKSALDRPISAAEAQLLANLAPLAGGSPRSLKRFVNLYRFTRAQGQDHKGALAFMLALDIGGTQAEIAAVQDALTGADPDADLDLHNGGPRLIEALTAVLSAQGKVSVSAARRAMATVRIFSFESGGR